MPRADFYLIDQPKYRAQPLRVVCVLAKRAYAAELATLVLARTQAEAEALEELLWSFEEDAFIPHQIAGEEDDAHVAVLIVPPGVPTADRPMVINLRESCASGSFDTVKEVVSAEPDEREGSRKRWAEYRRRGFEVQKYDL